MREVYQEIGTSRIFFISKNNKLKTCAAFLYNTSLSLQQKTKTMSIFSGYKPLHFSAMPKKCPRCGSYTMAEVVYEEHDDPLHFDKGKGFMYVGKIKGMNLPTWCCTDCGQPFYKNQIHTEDILYIYFSSDEGWTCHRVEMSIAVNFKKKKVDCSIFEDMRYRKKNVSWFMAWKLALNAPSLMEYKELNNSSMCDGMDYGFSCYLGNKENSFSVNEPDIENYPLLWSISLLCLPFKYRIFRRVLRIVRPYLLKYEKWMEKRYDNE